MALGANEEASVVNAHAADRFLRLPVDWNFAAREKIEAGGREEGKMRAAQRGKNEVFSSFHPNFGKIPAVKKRSNLFRFSLAFFSSSFIELSAFCRRRPCQLYVAL